MLTYFVIATCLWALDMQTSHYIFKVHLTTLRLSITWWLIVQNPLQFVMLESQAKFLENAPIHCPQAVFWVQPSPGSLECMLVTKNETYKIFKTRNMGNKLSWLQLLARNTNDAPKQWHLVLIRTLSGWWLSVHHFVVQSLRYLAEWGGLQHDCLFF